MGRIARLNLARAWRLAVVVGAVAAWAVDRVEVRGLSMLPTFAPGDRLLLVRRYRPLRVGDLVALDDPRHAARRIVKRVTAVHRDSVDVAGDNPSWSTDSRSFGPVPLTAVSHLVVRKYASAGEP
jgi:nickel-type superoxide dismutase maturation protease